MLLLLKLPSSAGTLLVVSLKLLPLDCVLNVSASILLLLKLAPSVLTLLVPSLETLLLDCLLNVSAPKLLSLLFVLALDKSWIFSLVPPLISPVDSSFLDVFSSLTPGLFVSFKLSFISFILSSTFEAKSLLFKESS